MADIFRCEFEKDCPTLKSLEELARKIKGKSFQYESITRAYDILKNNFCTIHYENCPTRQYLLGEEFKKKNPQRIETSDTSEVEKITTPVWGK